MTAPQLIEIVHGKPADLNTVNQLMTEAFDPRFGEAWTPSQCLGMIALPGVWFSIAWLDNQPAGFALARVVADECELLLIGITPALRRRGVGSALLRSIIADACERGAATLHLEVRANNDAVQLYVAEGFRKVGERHDYYRGKDGNLFDAHSFSRKIDSITPD